MQQLTEIKTIRFSKEDVAEMERLRVLNINPNKFIRIAYREKIQRELNQLIKEQEKNNQYKPPF